MSNLKLRRTLFFCVGASGISVYGRIGGALARAHQVASQVRLDSRLSLPTLAKLAMPKCKKGMLVTGHH
jgi:hypothetical protein